MSERCIVSVKFSPAKPSGEVRRAVGGFLRYIQQRGPIEVSNPALPAPWVDDVRTLQAPRGRSGARANLFGPHGPVGTKERDEFVDFVAGSLEGSKPHLFRDSDGRWRERRRAFYHFVISPERAQGLDLEALASTAVSRLESEMGVSGLRWVAAIHRNTRHPHVHLGLAGMQRDPERGYRRVDVTRRRLAAIKEAVGLEIQRQRDSRAPVRQAGVAWAGRISSGITAVPAPHLSLVRPPTIGRALRAPLPRLGAVPFAGESRPHRKPAVSSSLFRLRAVARRYQRQMQREVEDSARRLGREGAL